MKKSSRSTNGSKTVTRRAPLGARPPFAVAPLYVSQHNAEAHGFKGSLSGSRAFLDFVREHKVPHARLGKTVLVEAGVLAEKLRELAAHDAFEGSALERAEGDDSEQDSQPMTPDGVLALVGMRARRTA